MRTELRYGVARWCGLALSQTSSRRRSAYDGAYSLSRVTTPRPPARRRASAAAPHSAARATVCGALRYDEDASGAIDTDELFKLLSACKYNPDDEMAMKLMAEFGDGMEEELNFDQFSAMLRALDKRILFKQYATRRGAPRPRSTVTLSSKV